MRRIAVRMWLTVALNEMVDEECSSNEAAQDYRRDDDQRRPGQVNAIAIPRERRRGGRVHGGKRFAGFHVNSRDFCETFVFHNK